MYTIAFRRSPEDEPKKIPGTQPAQAGPTQTADALAEQIVSKTVGMAKVRPAATTPEEF